MCCASSESPFTLGLSSTTNIKSKRDKIGEGKSICSASILNLSNLPNLGLAAARTEHLEFKVAIIPALAILTVCCSSAS